MVKSKRGKTDSLKKSADREKTSEHLNQGLESSDDEAPEEVTFRESKNEALRSLKLVLDSAKREKELLKEKRRKRQELLQEQKKRKLLPAEVLEEIGSAPSKMVKESSAAEEDDAETKSDMKRKEKNRDEKHIKNLEGNYTVTTMKGGAAASFQQKTAEDFIHSRLYGLGSCRSTNNQMLSLQNKRGSQKSAAVQFVNKDWARQQKVKAEKLKKQWIHKLQVPS